MLEADQRWYEPLDPEAPHDQAWCDPWVFREEATGLFHCYVPARANEGDPPGRGVVGHARSSDLLTWEVLPPVTAPMGFGQLEVPQLHPQNGRWYLLFCSDVETQAPSFRDQIPGPAPTLCAATAPSARSRTSRASSRRTRPDGPTRGEWSRHDGPVFLAWNRTGSDGGCVGTITAPRRLLVDDDGHVVVEGA